MKLIVGLGNPGRIYAETRHNVGFKCLGLFARRNNIPLNKRQGKARVGYGQVEGVEVVLAKPQTFINLCGESVAALVRLLQIPLSDLLIIYDDLDLPLGRIRIRKKGGAGGHNGVKSIIQHLNSQDFPRLRVGIAPPQLNESLPPQKVKTPEYVLGQFTPEEKEKMKEIYPLVAEAIHCILSEGIDKAMNKYNTK